MPFRDQYERDIHFQKHGHEFGAADADEYERMAHQFMYGARGQNTRECTRPKSRRGEQDRVRFDFGTHFQAIACFIPAAFLRTFYVVKTTMIAHCGGEAQYFADECARIW